MTQYIERRGIALSQDGEGDVPLDRPVEVPDGAVHLARPRPRRASPGPMPSATALAVVPGATSLTLPSGSVTRRRVAHSADTPGGAAGGLDGANQK